MKHLKTKLMASVAMLMVATVMMSSASFAWFTISTAPEVKGVNTQLATNGNLEIALATPTLSGTTFSYTLPAASNEGDTGKNTTWGNNVDVSEYFTETTAGTPDRKLRPVSFSASRDADADKGLAAATAAAPTLSSPEFGTDGRMKGVKDLTAAVESVGDAETDGKLVVYKDSSDNVWAYRTDYFIRTNTAGEIFLADKAENLGNNEMGGGCFIKDKSGKKPGETGAATYLKDIHVYAVITPVTGDAGGAGQLGTAVYTGDLLKNNTFTSTKLFTATANTTYLVQTYIFWDGANLSNADMSDPGQNVKLNIQFEHAAKDATSAVNDLAPLFETTAATSVSSTD